MRIISIACRNLNSLRGSREHRLDFTAAPLEGCGLFAITGSTGAGKTTLLDALTLALYNRTPRQASSQALLSHGEGEGWAEVVYEVEAGRFLSRWSLQRAHKKRGGNLQTPLIEVCSLPDRKILAQNATQGIRQNTLLTGLDYDQFTRSVLLAQGSFAEFLRAKDDERAGLLERMTGTAIYKQLSRQSFERKTAEEKAEEALGTQLGFVNLLTAEEIAVKTAELADLTARHDAATKTMTVLREQHEWHGKLAELAGKLAAATAATGQAEAERASYRPALDRLAAHQAVEQFEEPWNAARTIEAEARKAGEKFHELDTLAKGAATRLGKAQAVTAELAAAWQKAEADLAREKPPLTEAIGQLPRLQTLHKVWQDAAATEASRRKAYQENQQRLTDAEAQLARDQQHLSDLTNWLTVHAADAQLPNRLTELDNLLASRSRVLKDHQERSGELKQLLSNLEGARQKRSAAGLAGQQAAEALQALEQEATAGTQAHAALWHEAQARTSQLNSELMAAQRQRGQWYEQLVGKQFLADHQNLLRAGQPCPVCGALEHPSIGTDTSEEAIQQLSGQIAEADEVLTALTLAQTTNQELLALLSTITPLAVAPVAARPLIDAATALRQARPLMATLLEIPTSRAGFKGQQAAATAAAASALEQQEAVQSQVRDITAKLEDIKQEGRQLADKITRLAADFNASFDPHQPQELQATFSKRARQFEEKQTTHHKLEKELSGTQAALGGLREQLAALHGEQQQAAEQCRQAKAEHTACAAAIAQAHPGFASPQVALAHWQQDERLAHQQHEEQQRAEAKAAESHRTLLARKADQETQRDDALARAKILFADLNRDLLAAGHDPKTLRLSTVLIFPVAERPTLRALHARLHRAVENAQAIQQQVAEEQRFAQQLAHSPEPAETVAAAYSEAQQAQQALRDELLLLSKFLADDEANRQRYAALADQLATQKAETRRWRNLHELIGHSEGTKFSRFAQGLTLARLVDLANQHLSQFNDRYQLRRKDDITLSLLVADAYDDCTRDVSTLSGGETFLASLALALGLAELASANAARLDSLFIDEGFGTLDADTLDIALAALSSLRRRGKTIGIITHVSPEILRDYIDTQVVVERIGQGTSSLRLLPEPTVA